MEPQYEWCGAPRLRLHPHRGATKETIHRTPIERISHMGANEFNEVIFL